MNKLYFVRHGQSQANHDNRRVGQVESPLTVLGRNEAMDAGEKAKSLGITKIYSSDLTRAHDTANIIAAAIGIAESQVVVDPRLREVNVGKLVGSSSDQLPGYWECAHEPGNPQEVEPLDQVEARLQAVFADIKQESGNILIVSHNAAGLILMRMLNHTDDAEKLKDLPNSHIIELHKAKHLDRLEPLS